MIAYMDHVEKYANSKNMANIIRHAIAHAPLASGDRIHFHGFGDSNYQSREMGEAFRLQSLRYYLAGQIENYLMR